MFGDLNALLIDVSEISVDDDFGGCIVLAHHAPKKVDWRAGQYHLELPSPDEHEFLEMFRVTGSTGLWGNRVLAHKLVESGLVPESFKKSKGVLFLGTLLARSESVTIHKQSVSVLDERYGLYVTLLCWETPEDNVDLDVAQWMIKEVSLNSAFSILCDGGSYDTLVLLPDQSNISDQLPLFTE